MARLLFQGHGSFRITTDNDVVIYVDPYAGSGYEIPADIILVTHQHGDHNQIQMPARKDSCVGYILTLDGVKVYALGDTSTTEEMKEYRFLHIDYALLPIDGVYNMDPSEASTCIDLIGAKHSIPIHMAPGKLFDKHKVKEFTAENRLIVKAGEEIEL